MFIFVSLYVRVEAKICMAYECMYEEVQARTVPSGVVFFDCLLPLCKTTAKERKKARVSLLIYLDLSPCLSEVDSMVPRVEVNFSRFFPYRSLCLK